MTSEAVGEVGQNWRDRVLPFVDDLESLSATGDLPDRRAGAIYDLTDELYLAVFVALVTGRPLLLRGEPGSGKSSLAAYVARNLDWRYYEHVVTSATRAEDFLWTFDAVRRLGDAQARQKGDPRLDLFDYVEPGVLWWALNAPSAMIRGRSPGPWARARMAVEPFLEDVNSGRKPGRVVVLIDELDKADPDVPNGLLVPLGSGQFEVAETGTVIRQPRRPAPAAAAEGEVQPLDLGRLLVVITTNEERQLPPAFVRRCVVYSIPVPTKDKLLRIARLHRLGSGEQEGSAVDEGVFGAVADRLLEIRHELAGHERKPSTAEYLDAVRACLDMGVEPTAESEVWQTIERVTMIKQPEADGDAR